MYAIHHPTFKVEHAERVERARLYRLAGDARPSRFAELSVGRAVRVRLAGIRNLAPRRAARAAA